MTPTKINNNIKMNKLNDNDTEFGGCNPKLN